MSACHIIHGPRREDECSHLYVMSDPFDRSEASFGLGEQTHGELKQAGQLEVKKRKQRVGRSAFVCTIILQDKKSGIFLYDGCLLVRTLLIMTGSKTRCFEMTFKQGNENSRKHIEETLLNLMKAK